MRTKEEVIVAYMGGEKGDNPDHYDVMLGGEVVKDVMNAWGEEVLGEVLLEIGNGDKKIDPEYTTQTCDMLMTDIVHQVRIRMYPNPTFD